MADDTPDARSSGTLWLVIGLVSGALLVTGAVVSPWISAAAFALSVFMHVRVRGRDRALAPPPTGTLWFVVTLIVGALLVTGSFQPPWVGAAALAASVLLYIRALARLRARTASDPTPGD
jgi:membrane protein implicated in regulation of membrane protease activity